MLGSTFTCADQLQGPFYTDLDFSMTKEIDSVDCKYINKQAKEHQSLKQVSWTRETLPLSSDLMLHKHIKLS